MAEQITDLGQAVLGSNYTAGDGVLHLSSIANLPTLATYSVRLGSGAIYTVTGVSGNDLSVTLEYGSDANASSGTSVVMVLSSRALQALISAGSLSMSNGQYLTDGTNYYGPLMQMYPPALQSFTWLYQGGASISTAGSQQTISATAAATAIYSQQQSLPSGGAVAYTVTALLAVLISSNQPAGGVIFISDGTKLITFQIDANSAPPRVHSGNYNSATSFNSDNAAVSQRQWYPPLQQGLIWLRISDDLTTRKYYLSADGYNWSEYGSEASGTFLTPTVAGWGMANASAISAGTPRTVTCLSFKITSP